MKRKINFYLQAPRIGQGIHESQANFLAVCQNCQQQFHGDRAEHLLYLLKQHYCAGYVAIPMGELEVGPEPKTK
jgi:hypothetical protein